MFDAGNEATPKIDDVAFGSADLQATRTVLDDAAGRSFTDYGPHDRDVSGAGLGAGLHGQGAGRPLVIPKAEGLEAALAVVRDAGAEIAMDVFEFPGGRRAHFTAPGGVEHQRSH